MMRRSREKGRGGRKGGRTWVVQQHGVTTAQRGQGKREKKSVKPYPVGEFQVGRGERASNKKEENYRRERRKQRDQKFQGQTGNMEWVGKKTPDEL